MPGTLPGSPILEFYNDAKVFVTGGTGFLGKSLIDKLLRVCPNINHIYILIRKKKDKDPQTRMKDLFADPLFNTLRKERPDFEKKVTCIPGDVNGIRLTMSDEDYDFLANEVTHVFHSAATVRFNEKLKMAIGINILGTSEMMTFVNKCTRLKIFVHVSTAYSQCVRKEIAEDFYDPPLQAEKVISLLNILTEEKMDSLTQEIIKPWPNTYSFTKAVAESLVLERGKSIPAVVFRPAIVMGTLKEPVQGWIDNIYGPTGILVGAFLICEQMSVTVCAISVEDYSNMSVGVGLMRVLQASSSTSANIIPVDLTVNAMLSCAWEVGSSFNNNTLTDNSVEKSTESGKKTEVIPKIYNFVVDKENSLTWEEFRKINLHHGREYPSAKAFWYYTLILTNKKLVYFFLTFFLHTLPGIFADGILLLLGKKPQILSTYHKIHVFSDAMIVFAVNQWSFANGNFKKLWARLSDADKEVFDFNMERVDWNHYLKGVIIGVRNFILKEDEESLASARRKMFFLMIAHRIVQFSFVFFSLWILSKIIFTFGDWKAQINSSVVTSSALFHNST